MNSTIGVESWNAVCRPIAALLAPGPRVTKQMPGPPAQLALRLGHEGGTALLPAGDEADALAMLVEAVERGEKALARHAERGVDALREQRLDERVAGEARVQRELMGRTRLMGQAPQGRQHVRRGSAGPSVPASVDPAPGVGQGSPDWR